MQMQFQETVLVPLIARIFLSMSAAVHKTVSGKHHLAAAFM
jgi:hypothetical protein